MRGTWKGEPRQGVCGLGCVVVVSPTFTERIPLLWVYQWSGGGSSSLILKFLFLMDGVVVETESAPSPFEEKVISGTHLVSGTLCR